MSTPIIILGMHRSGTSCLAGILRSAGVDFRNVQTSNPYNAKGNIENLAVTGLNDSLLEYNGGSWDDPPELVRWPEILLRQRAEILAQLETNSSWGFKDPRTLFTLEGWLAALPPVRIIGTFRHPAAVAASLQTRNGFPLRRGLGIWKRYNRRLLSLWRKWRFPLLCFDQPATDYLASVQAAMAAIGMPPVLPADDFFSDALRHHGGGGGAELDAETLALYELLLRAAGLSSPSGNAPRISIIVAAHNMARELPRTLESLTPFHQRGVTGDEYEVLVADNGSSAPLPPEAVAAFGPNFHSVPCPKPRPSPCAALNFAAANARGEILGLHIDGARILSPGILRKALDAFAAYSRNALVLTLGRHCGPAPQQESRAQGYDAEAEDRLLAESGWEYDGYRLFRHSVPAQSARDGLFAPIPESNCLFMHTATFAALGGFDTAFDLPGGGLANHDLLARALELPAIRPVVLLGEATFHQVHGSASTGAAAAGSDPWKEYERQYQAIRGKPYTVPDVPPVFLGELPAEAEADILHSARFLEAKHLRMLDESRGRLLWLGFHAQEKDRRWMSEQGAIVQRAGGEDIRLLEFQLACGDAACYTPFPFSVTIRTHAGERHIRFSAGGERKHLRLKVRPDGDRVLARLSSQSSFVPAELNLSRDGRRLSVLISHVVAHSVTGKKFVLPRADPKALGGGPLFRLLSRARALLRRKPADGPGVQRPPRP